MTKEYILKEDVLKEIEKGICSLSLRIKELKTYTIQEQPEFKVGDNCYVVYKNKIERGYITLFRFNEEQEEVKENEFKITKSEIYHIKLYTQDNKLRFCTDKLYKTKEEAEQALKECKE